MHLAGLDLQSMEQARSTHFVYGVGTFGNKFNHVFRRLSRGLNPGSVSGMTCANQLATCLCPPHSRLIIMNGSSKKKGGAFPGWSRSLECQTIRCGLDDKELIWPHLCPSLAVLACSAAISPCSAPQASVTLQTTPPWPYRLTEINLIT